MALEPLIHPRCLPPANAFTEMAGVRGMDGTSSYMQRTNRSGNPSSMISGGNDYGSFGGSFMKIGMDPWAEVDTWLGYGEDTGDYVISHPEKNDALRSGAANGHPGSLAVERVSSGNDADIESLEDLTADRVTSANGDEALLTTFGPNKNKLVEDPMQIETETAVPNNIALVWDSNETGQAASEPTPDDSLSKEGVRAQPPSATNVAEPTSQGGELQTSQLAATERDLVTTSMDMVTSTSVSTSAPISTSQGNQASSSVIESKTLVLESVEVTTTTVSAAEDILTFPKAAHQAGSDSDSDGPLPDIVDGDPDPESD